MDLLELCFVPQPFRSSRDKEPRCHKMSILIDTFVHKFHMLSPSPSCWTVSILFQSVSSLSFFFFFLNKFQATLLIWIDLYMKLFWGRKKIIYTRNVQKNCEWICLFAMFWTSRFFLLRIHVFECTSDLTYTGFEYTSGFRMKSSHLFVHQAPGVGKEIQVLVGGVSTWLVLLPLTWTRNWKIRQQW